MEIGKPEDKLGIRATSTVTLNFDECVLDSDTGAGLLGAKGQGFKIAMNTLDSGRIGVAAQAVGIGQVNLTFFLLYFLFYIEHKIT